MTGNEQLLRRRDHFGLFIPTLNSVPTVNPMADVFMLETMTQVKETMGKDKKCKNFEVTAILKNETVDCAEII